LVELTSLVIEVSRLAEDGTYQQAAAKAESDDLEDNTDESACAAKAQSDLR
jgi:hypothetical protein